MDAASREAHDAAWGVDFGDPKRLHVPHPSAHHPAAQDSAPTLRTRLQNTPLQLPLRYFNGLTMLQLHALAGNAPIVEVLLDAGASPDEKTPRGDDAADLARILGWPECELLLR